MQALFRFGELALAQHAAVFIEADRAHLPLAVPKAQAVSAVGACGAFRSA